MITLGENRITKNLVPLRAQNKIGKTQNKEKQKTSFLKRIGRKCRLTLIDNEQNNDQARTMYKIQFHSSLNICLVTENKFSHTKKWDLGVLQHLRWSAL